MGFERSIKMDLIFLLLVFMLAVVKIPTKISNIDNISTPSQKPAKSMRPIYTDVVGVTFDNRQKYIVNCRKGQPLTIVKEKRNNYNTNAVAVYSNGNRIGYLNNTLASEIAEEMDNGTKFFGFVNEITGSNGDSSGINIMLTTSPTDCVTKTTEQPGTKTDNTHTTDDSLMTDVKTTLNETKTIDNFYSFVTGIPKDKLLDVFWQENNVLLGNSGLNHYRGRNGGIEFIGAILLWIYSNKRLNDNRGDTNSYALLNLYLADVIGCAYNNMPPVEWSDRLEDKIRSTEVIEYSEFSEVYRYIEENFGVFLNNFDFVVTVPSQRREFEKKYSLFTVAFNKLNTIEEVIEFFTKQGLAFNKYIWLADCKIKCNKLKKIEP